MKSPFVLTLSLRSPVISFKMGDANPDTRQMEVIMEKGKFKRFMRILVCENWGLKVFALLFAAFAWLMLSLI
jgi:hypothetical protein